MLFRDREEAGRRLADEVARTGERQVDLVLALPRGGVPVAAPVAAAFGVELDVLVVRKLGMPGHTELAMGAVAAGGVRVLNEDVIASFGVDPGVIEQVAERELAELNRRERLYRGERKATHIEGQAVLLVDDGLATGATMRVAIEAVRRRAAGRVGVAVPVAATDVCEALRELADEVLCLEQPQPFIAVGRWYQDFPQTGDDEVRRLLATAHQEAGG